MATLTLNGVSLHYEVLGEGAPIVLLHGGLGLDHTYLRPDFDQLVDFGQVVYLDQRGNGRSGRTDDPLTIEQLAADAAGFIEAIGAPATVIGHSFGGFVAQELAISHPEAASRLVLLSTTPGQLGAADDPEADQGPPAPAGLTAVRSEPPMAEEEMKPYMDRLLPFYMHGSHRILAHRMADTVHRLRAMHEGSASLSSWSSVDRLSNLDIPTLLIAGEHDHFTARQQSERIARLVPGATVHVSKESGHFPWLEQPDDFWGVLRGWLDPDVTPTPPKVIGV